MMWQHLFTTSPTNQSLKESTARMSRPCRCSSFTGSLFILSKSWLWYMVGVTSYVNVHACAQRPHPCRLLDCSTKVFFVKFHSLPIREVFSLESFPLYGIPVNESTPPWKNKLAFSLKTMKLLAITPWNKLNHQPWPPKTNHNLLNSLQIQLMRSESVDPHDSIPIRMLLIAYLKPSRSN